MGGNRAIRHILVARYPQRVPAVAIAAVDAPWGVLRVAVTAQGVLALEQQAGEAEFVERVTRRMAAWVASPADPPGAERLLAHVVERLRAYAAGDGSALVDLPIDLRDRPAWDRQVLDAVRGLESGTTASYGEVARMIGRAGAARAVGGAVGRNPIGLVIPCHRVIAGDGTLGGYGGGWWGGRQAGLELKRELLAREGVDVPATGVGQRRADVLRRD
jgi:methylated-DNA-[protein]-cysteine S-methyltransferase